MTGFGKGLVELKGKSITIEIKSLNSKQLDINTRMPGIYKEKDLDIRNLLAIHLKRGKIDFSLQLEYMGEESNFKLNKELALNYYQQLKELSANIGEETHTDFISVLARMPDILKSEKKEIDEQEWLKVERGIRQAIEEIDGFRTHEGNILEKDLSKRVFMILEFLSTIIPFEEKRIDIVRERLSNNMAQFYNGTYDANRFEQELLYFLEKADITEEKVRLKKHCDYFIETLQQSESQGKKLGFISQEIGREVNTLGAKAYDADMQRIIVQMKDELEKIKEQLLNIL